MFELKIIIINQYVNMGICTGFRRFAIKMAQERQKFYQGNLAIMPTANMNFVPFYGQTEKLAASEFSLGNIIDDTRSVALESRKLDQGIEARTAIYNHKGREGVLVIGSDRDAIQVGNIVYSDPALAGRSAQDIIVRTAAPVALNDNNEGGNEMSRDFGAAASRVRGPFRGAARDAGVRAPMPTVRPSITGNTFALAA